MLTLARLLETTCNPSPCDLRPVAPIYNPCIMVRTPQWHGGNGADRPPPGLHGPEGGTSCRAGFPAPDKAGIVPNKRRSPQTLSDKACRKGGTVGLRPGGSLCPTRSPAPALPRMGPFPGHFAIGKRAGPCPKQERRHIPGHAPSKKHLTLGGGLSMLRTCGPRGTAGRVLFPVCPCLQGVCPCPAVS